MTLNKIQYANPSKKLKLIECFCSFLPTGVIIDGVYETGSVYWREGFNTNLINTVEGAFFFIRGICLRVGVY